LSAALLALVAAATDRVHAAGNHHSSPLGGRSALMGGTGIALGVDGAVPFVNPANVARIANRSIAFSARFFRYSHQSFDHWHNPAAESTTLQGPAGIGSGAAVHNDLGSVPDTGCYFFSARDASRSDQPGARAGRQKLAACLGKTEDAEWSLRVRNFKEESAAARVDQTHQFDAYWARLNLGLAWALYLSDDLAIGASLFVVRTKYEHAATISSVLEDLPAGTASGSSYQSLKSGYSWDVVPSLGVTVHVTDSITAALGLRLPGPHVLGGYRGGYTNDVDGGSRQQWTEEGTFKAVPPLRVGLGVGAEWQFLRLEANATFNAGQTDYMVAEVDRDELLLEAGSIVSRAEREVTLRESTRGVFNAGAGAEFFLSPRLSLLGGVQTDKNALEPLDPGAEHSRLVRTRLDYYRMGLGISSYTDFGDLIFGARFDYGQGKATAVDAFSTPQRLAKVPLEEYAVLLVIAGSVSWGGIKQTAVHVEDAVQGDAAPQPAEPPEPMVTPPR
jgi:hypothetical protein